MGGGILHTIPIVRQRAAQRRIFCGTRSEGIVRNSPSRRTMSEQI